MATLTFGATTNGTIFTPTTLILPDVNLAVGGTSYKPFAGTSFADGANPNDKNFLKFAFRLPTGGNETVHLVQTGGVYTSGTSASGATTTGPLSLTLIPAGGLDIVAGGASTYYWGTKADMLAMLKAITISRPSGDTPAYAVPVVMTLQYYTNFPGNKPGIGANGINSGTGSSSTTPAYTVAPCYVRGTLIAVPGGSCAVEDLRTGDVILTADGAAKPVKWIGVSFQTAADIAATPSLRPVLFQPDAIAPGIPTRALFVSPMHGMMIDDVIVPAAALVNGVTILRPDCAGNVDYFHVELDAHELILAEGAAGETFMDDASRAMFDNAAEYTALYGGETVSAMAAPRVQEGYLLEAIHRRLAGTGVAGAVCGELHGVVERITDGVLEGWATNGAAPVELEVLVDGEVVSRLLANRFRTDLDDAGIPGGRAGFTVALPASVDSLKQVTVRSAAGGATLPVMGMEAVDA